MAFVDEPLLGRGDVGFVSGGERRLEASHGNAEVHLQGDLAARRGFDVDGGHLSGVERPRALKYAKELPRLAATNVVFGTCFWQISQKTTAISVSWEEK
jgi:hypothetical protein